MAHFRCARCRGRVARDIDPGEPNLCPVCGEPLQPVGGAAEIIGLPILPEPTSRLDIADHIRQAIARNDAEHARRVHPVHPDPRPPRTG